jgi:hypothetical protein
MPDLIDAAQDACDDKTWHTDETKTLAIEFDGQVLEPRKCELRRQAPLGVFAVKFEATVEEMAALTSQDALTWRFTLRNNKGKLVGKKKEWKVARLTSAGESRYQLCLEPL